MEGLGETSVHTLKKSGESSVHTLKKTMIKEYIGVDSESDPTLDKPQIRSRKNEVIGIKETLTRTLDKGVWNKYGSKDIKGSQFKREYWRCRDRNCKAKKQVQQIQKDPNSPLVYRSTYLNEHTCCRQAGDYNIKDTVTTSMIKFDTDHQVPLVAADHHHHQQQGSIKHEDVSLWNHFNYNIDMKDEDEFPWLNLHNPLNAMEDEEDDLIFWLNPIISCNDNIMGDEDDYFSFNPTIYANNINDNGDGDVDDGDGDVDDGDDVGDGDVDDGDGDVDDGDYVDDDGDVDNDDDDDGSLLNSTLLGDGNGMDDDDDATYRPT